MTDLPVLPYAGTSGWSGGETSRERADELDTSGKTESYQRDALQYLLEAGRQGLTYTELNVLLGCRTQTGAAVLSILHKEGLVTRLSARRSRCQIYVLPEYVEGREQVPHRPHSNRAKVEALQARVAELEAQLAEWEEAFGVSAP